MSDDDGGSQAVVFVSICIKWVVISIVRAIGQDYVTPRVLKNCWILASFLPKKGWIWSSSRFKRVNLSPTHGLSFPSRRWNPGSKGFRKTLIFSQDFACGSISESKACQPSDPAMPFTGSRNVQKAENSRVKGIDNDKSNSGRASLSR